MSMSTLKVKEEDDDGVSFQQNEEDRLSSLPDSLLITIISFLPINSAVTTSVLSQRWRYLWTHTTNLSVTQSFDNHHYFVTTLNHIISQLQSPKLDTFHLQPSLPKLLPNATPFHSDLPVHQICLRNPKVFWFNLGYSPCPKGIFNIPHSLFLTQSLVELKLFANIQLNFLHDTIATGFNLPNLKKLTLVLFGSNCGLITSSFFEGCPLLEYLSLSLWSLDDDYNIYISNPRLKWLSLDVTPRGWLKECKFVIDAPILEKCIICGDLMAYQFVSNPSNLQQVFISIEEACFGAHLDYNSKLQGLIHGISCVASLTLEESAIHLFNFINHCETLPVFRNLNHLSFSYDVNNWTNGLPGCLLLGQLNRLDVRELWCDDFEISLLQHILSNATALKQLHASVLLEGEREMGEDQLRREYEFCKKVFMLPKSSLDCQIEFFGLAITASSKEFKDGVLTCQIRDHLD